MTALVGAQHLTKWSGPGRVKTDRAAMIVQSLSREYRWCEGRAILTGLPGVEADDGRPLRHILPSGKPLDLGWAVGSAEFL